MGNAHSSPPSTPRASSLDRKVRVRRPRWMRRSMCTSAEHFDDDQPTLVPFPCPSSRSQSTLSSADEKTPEGVLVPSSPSGFLPPPPADKDGDYSAFLEAYPQYRLTWILDALRRSEFARLDRAGGEAYVDYMGGALYPESLVRQHAAFLCRHTLGNTHSVSNSSTLSATHAAGAREAVLAFFRAAPAEYTVVFTPNASGALKLVGEAFPFAPGSACVLPADAHNSVHGLRRFAARAGADVRYVAAPRQGGGSAEDVLAALGSDRPAAPSLLALTGQSNITNSKAPLAVLRRARELGYATVLDAAALAPTSTISLADAPVDAMAVSFYKMFGYPTGVGALVVRRAFLETLSRPWFAGGTVDVVQAPGEVVTMAPVPHERFEDGTINYLALPAIADGLRFLSAYLPFLPLRLSCLVNHLVSSLTSLTYPNGAPVVRILSRLPSRPLHYVGEQSDVGSVIALLFLTPSGALLPNSFIAHASAQCSISLRTGCMCNPGGAAALLALEPLMAQLARAPPGVTLGDFERMAGHELGVVRLSLGLASNYADVQRVLAFARRVADGRERGAMWARWVAEGGGAGAHARACAEGQC